MGKEVTNFVGCTFLKKGDKVKLSLRAKDWKFGNTTTPQYIVDGLQKEKEYVVTDVTPILKVVGADQQFLSVDGAPSMTYPCWCFDKIEN